MVDAIFGHPRLARIYDALDSDRSDLDAYLALVDGLAAESVLDIGCGTGTLACLLALRGKDVVAVDPAQASLDVARRKPGADRVRWFLGDATTLPPLSVAVVTMTANVAQVFLSDKAWAEALVAARSALKPDGTLVFESRDPERRAWEEWVPELSHRVVDVPGVGGVEAWVDLTKVDLPFVSFRWTYRFHRDGAVLTSDSTLRFRPKLELTDSLEAAGFTVREIREAPDRRGKEHVFIAGR